MAAIKSGLIIKSIGGFYTVESPDGAYECVPRGIFRKEGKSPCVGDRVEFSDENVITKILPRKNHLIRPPLANMDQLIFVVSVCEPSPNLTLLDKFIAIAEYKQIKPVIVLTKVYMGVYLERKEQDEEAKANGSNRVD